MDARRHIAMRVHNTNVIYLFSEISLLCLKICSDIMFEINFSMLEFYVNQLYYAKELYILNYKTISKKGYFFFWG